MRRWMPACVLLLLSWHGWAIGVRTHAEIGQMAMDACAAENNAMLPGLGDLFTNADNRRAFFSGCAFPDWGYAGINHDAAEDAHWRPFHQAYAEVLQRRFPLPWDAEAQRQIAFFLGLISHSLTDIPWHFSSSTDKSFLEMGRIHDNAGHSDVEIGCDIILYAEKSLSPSMHLDTWWPLDLLVDVYARHGRPVTREQLAAGTARAQSMFFGGWIAGALQARQWKERMPWVYEHLNDYYYGGMAHGAAITTMANRYYYARFQGWHYYQNTPAYDAYVRRNGDYTPHTPAADTHLMAAHPSHNAGAEPLLEIGRGPGGDLRRGMLRFDVSNISPDAAIERAVLWLYFAGRRGAPAQNKTLDAYTVKRSWHAGAQQSGAYHESNGAPAAEGEATWESAGRNPWIAGGCGGAAQGHAEAPAASLCITPEDAPGQWKSWEITSAVQDWIARPHENFGLLIRERAEAAEDPGIFQFYSSDAFRAREDGFCGGARIMYRPVLIVFPASSR